MNDVGASQHRRFRVKTARPVGGNRNSVTNLCGVEYDASRHRRFGDFRLSRERRRRRSQRGKGWRSWRGRRRGWSWRLGRRPKSGANCAARRIVGDATPCRVGAPYCECGHDTSSQVDAASSFCIRALKPELEASVGRGRRGWTRRGRKWWWWGWRRWGRRRR